jgi:hypothetical protein
MNSVLFVVISSFEAVQQHHISSHYVYIKQAIYRFYYYYSWRAFDFKKKYGATNLIHFVFLLWYECRNSVDYLY